MIASHPQEMRAARRWSAMGVSSIKLPPGAGLDGLSPASCFRGWNLLRRLVLPPAIQSWSLTSLQQNGRPPHPACHVLHSATRRKLLDTASVSADRRVHRATRVALDVIGRTGSFGEPDRGREGFRHGERSALGRGEISSAGDNELSHQLRVDGDEVVTSPTGQGETRKKMVQIADPGLTRPASGTHLSVGYPGMDQSG
jgi:hypothetical protein